jgi:hypothetical protein
MGSSRSVLRCIAICLVALVLGSGCYGKSVLSSGVSKWHSGLQWNKYSKEAMFVPLFFLVYPFTSIVDYFILNSIDYWTVEGDPLVAKATPAEGEKSPRIAGTEAELAAAPYRMVIESNRSVLEDENGRPVAELRRLDDGSLALLDLKTGAERRIAPEEVASLARR